MTLRISAKAKHYRCYTCPVAARQGKTGCKGRTIGMDRLDHLVVVARPGSISAAAALLLSGQAGSPAPTRKHPVVRRPEDQHTDL